MSEPSPELRRLIEAHRRVRRPSPALRQRVASALAADQRREPRERHEQRQQRQQLRQRQQWQRWIGGSLVGAVVGLAALLLMHWVAAGWIARGRSERVPDGAQYQRATPPEPPSVRTPAPTTAPAAEPQAPAPAAPSSALEQPSALPSPPPRSRPRTTPPSSSAVAPTEPASEVRLLREAEVALSTDPSRALALLHEHERQFPRTTLALERRALRILATCAATPSPAARRERDAFLGEHPASAYAARVRAACR